MQDAIWIMNKKTSLIKTEVVLKYPALLIECCFVEFNKNRSCIEILNPNNFAVLVTEFNKNRSCIEMIGLTQGQIMGFAFNKNRSCIEIKRYFS